MVVDQKAAAPSVVMAASVEKLRSTLCCPNALMGIVISGKNVTDMKWG